jgi:hypothetical protein
VSPHIAEVTLSIPPANLIVPETVSRLHDFVVELRIIMYPDPLAR